MNHYVASITDGQVVYFRHEIICTTPKGLNVRLYVDHAGRRENVRRGSSTWRFHKFDVIRETKGEALKALHDETTRTLASLKEQVTEAENDLLAIVDAYKVRMFEENPEIQDCTLGEKKEN